MANVTLFVASFLPITLTVCMLWVVVSDASRYIISNQLNAIILALYVLAAIALPIDPFSALGAAAIMLVIGLGMFSLGLMGGGDIKLLVVLTLWTGWNVATPQFIFLTAIFGGLLVLLILPLRMVAPALWLKLRPTKTLPRLLTKKEPVPYGLAIAGAFTYLLWTDSIVGLQSAAQ